jgi:DEAD/DEAH box helicase
VAVKVSIGPWTFDWPTELSIHGSNRSTLTDCFWGTRAKLTVYTGGGKSLVADILMLKKIIENTGKKAILVLPYVALVQEKTKWLRRAVEGVWRDQEPSQREFQLKRTSLGGEANIRIVGFFGGSKSRTTWADTDIAVCTIEKVAAHIQSPFRQSCRLIKTLTGKLFGQLGNRRLFYR